MNSSNANASPAVPPSTPMVGDGLGLDGGLAGAGVGVGVGVVTGGSTRRTSRVWRYFGMVDNCHYICRLCSFVGAYTNTTNMRKHIQHHHPERFQDILDHTRPSSRPYFAGSLPRLRQPLQYPQHSHAHHYPPSLLYPPPVAAAKRVMLPKPAEPPPPPYLHAEARSDSGMASLGASSHDCSVAAAAAAAAATCQASLQQEHTSDAAYSSLLGHAPTTTAAAAPPPVSLGAMSPEETKLVKQLLPALVEATDSSTDTDTPVRGLQSQEDRSGSSEFSQHNSDDVPITVSPEHFLSEGNDQDEPTPVPPTPSQPKPESYQLRHNNHLTIVLEALARDESFMDVTLTAQGRSLKAHKSVLSAVSSYFRGVLRDNPCQHPIIIMPRDVRFEELFSIVNYIYKGEMTVAAEDLTSLLKTAEILQVSGLAPSDSTATVNPQADSLTIGVRSSSNSSSASSTNVPPVSRPSRPIKAPSQSLSTPPARPKSIDSMINPADFIDVDMTCVKEEILSGGEEEKDELSNKEPCPQPPDCSRAAESSQAQECPQQPPECSQTTDSEAKDDDDTDQVLIGFPTPYEQNFEQPMASTSSQDSDFQAMGVKSDPETNFTQQLTKPNDNPQPLQCPHCDEQYRDVDSIDSHLRLKHPSKPSFTCKCGRIFTRQIHHQAHARMCSSSS